MAYDPFEDLQELSTPSGDVRVHSVKGRYLLCWEPIRNDPGWRGFRCVGIRSTDISSKALKAANLWSGLASSNRKEILARERRLAKEQLRNWALKSAPHSGKVKLQDDGSLLLTVGSKFKNERVTVEELEEANPGKCFMICGNSIEVVSDALEI